MQHTELTAQQQRVRHWVLVSWAALLGLVCWQQLHQELGWSQLGWALCFSLPILVTLPGLWHGRRYTHQWATLCVLPYFIVGVTEAVANAVTRTWALSLLGVSLLWFFALLAFVRVTPKTNTHA